MELDLFSCTVLFITFMSGIMFNYALGYRQGVNGGHTFGVYEVTSWLMANSNISNILKDADQKLSVKEITHKILIELEKRRPELKMED
jgi:hypothetical protein